VDGMLPQLTKSRASSGERGSDGEMGPNVILRPELRMARVRSSDSASNACERRNRNSLAPAEAHHSHLIWYRGAIPRSPQ
jgi:hypothetical protein